MSKGRQSKFNSDILKEVDGNNDAISSWCIPAKKMDEGICIVCNVSISCKHHGVSAIKRHSATAKHKELCQKRRDSEGRLKKSAQQRISFAAETVVRSHADIVSTSETLFAISIARNDVPYSFCDVAGKMFPRMFPDSQIAKEFSCNRSKLSYLISDGIGPYLKEDLVKDIINFNCFYCVQIDETPLPEKRSQQLDILIRYFCEKSHKIVVRHLQSFFIDKSTAANIFKHVTEALASLPPNKLLCLFSDGPPVMQCLFKMMKDAYPQVVNVSTCTLHVVHNAFGKALNEFGGELEILIMDIYYFFKRSAVNSSELSCLQSKLGLPEHLFVRHVSNRWLTLESSLARFIEQFACLKEFFQKDVKTKCEGIRLKRIKQVFVEDKLLLAKALFLKNASDLLMPFLKQFQSEEPLIHIVYDELVALVKRIMGRFLKLSSFHDTVGVSLKSIDMEKGNNWLKVVEIGGDTTKELSNFPSSARKEIEMGARSFYKTCAKYLVAKLPLDNKLLMHSQCLHPIVRTEEKSLNSVKHLAAFLPTVVNPSQVSLLVDEWIRYQCEDIDESTFHHSSGYGRIDSYWDMIFKKKDSSGKPKYEILPVLVKAVLSLAHGNSDVERGFSMNKHMLAGRSQLNIHSVNGIRSIKSHFQDDDTLVNFNVSTSLLKSVKNSWKRYHERLDLESSVNKKRKIDQEKGSEDEKLKTEELELQKQLKTSQDMLVHAEEKISKGISKNDMSCVESGQVLLKEGKDRIKETLKALDENRKSRLEFNKKNKK